MTRSLLTIAGTDPTSGAGVTADLAVFNDFGFHGLWVPTAVLDQDSATVHRLDVLSAEATAATVDRALAGGQPAGVKLGLLASSQVAAALSEVLRPLGRRIPLVFDPVLASGGGAGLADAGLVATLQRQLLPLVSVLTPNAPEAATLSGRAVGSLAEAEVAARALLDLGAQAVLLKGGHLPGAPGDVWATQDGVEILPNRADFGVDVHGTGCHLSSALLTLLALGAPGGVAARGARRYLAACVESAEPLAGETAGRPVVVHGDVTRRAARHVIDESGCGDG